MTDKKIHCLVVDDEPLAAQLIASYVERTPYLLLSGVADSADAATGILRDNDVDLVFLDINMPRTSGMDLARRLGPGVRVVFTTAYADYAVEGFAVNALDYLLKPVSYPDFLRAADRAANILLQPSPLPQPTPPATPAAPEYITVKSEYRLIRIPVADILYIEGLKDYVKIVVATPDFKPVLTLMSMRALEEMLAPAGFLRVHRSFIVNLARTRIIERNSIIMDGRAIPVSDTCRPALMQALGLRD